MRRVSLLNELRDIIVEATYNSDTELGEYKTATRNYSYPHTREMIKELEKRARNMGRKSPNKVMIPKTQYALKYIYEHIDIVKRVISQCKDDNEILRRCQKVGLETRGYGNLSNEYEKEDFLYALQLIPKTLLN